MRDIKKTSERDEKVCQIITQMLKKKGYLGNKLIIESESSILQYRFVRLITDGDICVLSIFLSDKGITASRSLFILFNLISNLSKLTKKDVIRVQ